MLVKLYELPKADPIVEKLAGEGIILRRALAPEKERVVTWVRKMFGQGWGSEVDVAFSRAPVSCYVAQESKTMLGFACYDATCKNFFGPTGVDPAWRGRQIGAGLLILALQAMADEGYGYGIIGGAGPTEFYEKIVNAQVIEGSKPGIYRHMFAE
jgi:GNAT superfamily N-acetyltransferase